MNKFDIDYFKTLKSDEIFKRIKEDDSNAFLMVNDHLSFENSKVIGIKDIHTNGFGPTTVGSKVLENFISPYKSTIVKLLEDADFKITGTLNLDEFAMGFSNERSYFGGVKNALNSDYVPGGSSGGSAVAVAKGLIPIATGTDTGGSIRQPAAFNGIYGMKPTYGLISRYGTVAFASSFDTVGLLSQTIEDNAHTLEVLAQNDYQDLTNYVPENYSATDLIDSEEKMVIGYIKEWMDLVEDPKIVKAIQNKLELFKQKGYVVKEISIPTTIYSFELYLVLAYSEASANLSRYDGIKFGLKNDKAEFSKYRTNLGDEVKKRLVIGAYMTSKKYTGQFFENAMKLRTMMKKQFAAAFEQCDILLGPVTPLSGIKKDVELDSKTGYINDIFLIPANLTGIPAMSVPIQKTKHDLEIGMQVMANKYEENKIYNIAKKLESWGENE